MTHVITNNIVQKTRCNVKMLLPTGPETSYALTPIIGTYIQII